MGDNSWGKEQLYDGITFTWDLLYRCNYRCSYCWYEMDNIWAKIEGEHPLILPYQRWVDAWKRVYDRHGRCRLDVLGGEPFFYPQGTQLFIELARMHNLCITTNLSMSLKDLEQFVRSVKPETVYFQASFHHEFAEEKVFLEKINILKAHGFSPAISVVAHPPVIPRLNHYRSLFETDASHFSVNVFRGTYQGKPYPESYTREERRALHGSDDSLSSEQDSKWVYQVERPVTLGKLCCSGVMYANVKADGNVFRCGPAGPPGFLGNLLSPDFKIWTKPMPCPLQHCNCQEYLYILSEQEKTRPEFVKKMMEKSDP
ncbi:MAG TPA: radical SAM protein [Elusimicrobiota bacterium]|nr:radical SAM protein [Elusimicrobiota bacterium]